MQEEVTQKKARQKFRVIFYPNKAQQRMEKAGMLYLKQVSGLRKRVDFMMRIFT